MYKVKGGLRVGEVLCVVRGWVSQHCGTRKTGIRQGLGMGEVERYGSGLSEGDIV